MKGFKGNNQDFEYDFFMNWKPVEVNEYWSFT